MLSPAQRVRRPERIARLDVRQQDRLRHFARSFMPFTPMAPISRSGPFFVPISSTRPMIDIARRVVAPSAPTTSTPLPLGLVCLPDHGAERAQGRRGGLVTLEERRQRPGEGSQSSAASFHGVQRPHRAFYTKPARSLRLSAPYCSTCTFSSVMSPLAIIL